MNTLKVTLNTLLCTALLCATLLAEARPSNKWRIEVSEGANSHGHIVLRILPEGGTPIDVKVEIDDGTGENAVAKKLVQGLEEQLPEGAYHVERDDGEDVLIKKRGDTPNFDLEIVSNDVKSVRLNLERE